MKEVHNMQTTNMYMLPKIVIQASEANTWKEAVKEWSVVAVEDDRESDLPCICGHEHLRWLYTIENQLNGNRLFPIGSACINKFERPELDEQADTLRNIIDLAKLADTRGYEKSINIKDLSRKIIKYITDNNILPANRYNGWNGKNDGKFLLDMFNQRKSFTDKQNQKLEIVINKGVYPWLRDVWRTYYKCEPNF